VCLVNRKEAENKEEIRAARSPRGFSNLDFKNEGSKSAQSHLINEIETDSIDLSRLDQTFLKTEVDFFIMMDFFWFLNAITIEDRKSTVRRRAHIPPLGRRLAEA
jgi:hypothetical protein